MKRALYLIFFLSLNPALLIEAANVYNTITSSFEEDGSKVFCVLMLKFENQVFAGSDIPIVTVNMSDQKVDFKKSTCKNYVITLRNPGDINHLDRRQLRVN